MFGNNDSKMKFAAAGGLVLGLIFSALSYLEYFSGIGLGLVVFVVYVGGIVYFTKEYGKTVEHFGYGKSLGFGVLLSMFTYIVFGFYNYVYASFINPAEYSEKIKEALELMKQNGFVLNDDGFENIDHMIRNPVFVTITYLITGTVYGLAVSLITSVFTKKD